MPWYIPIIAAVLGGLFGWLIRHFYDEKVERSLLRREIFKDYMNFRADNVSGLVAIQQVGALRLSKKEFHRLIEDLTRCGHPPATKKDMSSVDGIADLYDVLLFAAKREEMIFPGESLYDLLADLKLNPDKESP